MVGGGVLVVSVVGGMRKMRDGATIETYVKSKGTKEVHSNGWQ